MDLRDRSSRWRDYRSMAGPAARVGFGFAIALGLVGFIGFFLDDRPPLAESGGPGEPLSLLVSAGVTALVAAVFHLIGKHHESDGVTRREATVAVVFVWLAATISGALPFWIGGGMSFVDSIFESASGLTTTGATVITDIEMHSRTLLLWRSVIQWLGGMGIVVLFVAVFPSLGVGGKRMLRGEVPGTSSKGLKPRVGETALALWKLYVFFTLLVTGTYWVLGLGFFDAVCHSMTTVSTGGFSTNNGSIGGFGLPAIEYACALFMLIGSVNYGIYFVALRNRSGVPFKVDTELRVYLAICLITLALLCIGLFSYFDGDAETTFRHALFTVGTTVSSTGYGIDDPTAFPPLARFVVLTLMFVGGCAGSTAGGIKVERVIIVAKQAYRQINRYTQPRIVQLIRMGGKPVDDAVVGDVAAFMTVFFGTLGIGIGFFVLVEGVSVPAALGATLTSLSNMGPGLFHESVNDNFAHYGNATKLFTSVLMILGRLEFFTLLVLLTPSLWRR